LRGLRGGLFGAQLLALLGQPFEGRLFFLERGCGGGNVEGGIGGDGRVVVRAAQRAGFARLQLPAMRFQALDAVFLFEQFLLVGDLGGEFLVLLAQDDQALFLGRDLVLKLLQLRGLGRLQCSQFAAALGERFELLPAVEAGLFALPVLTQFGQGLAGQALILLALAFCQLGVGGGSGFGGGVDRKSLRGELAGGSGLFLFELLLRLVLGGKPAREFCPLFELLAPDAEAFAELGVLRLGSAELVELLRFALTLLQGLQRLLGDLGAVVSGGEVLIVLFGLQFFARGVQGLEFGFAVLAGGAGLLPLQMQRLQGFGRVAGGEPGQLRRGGGEGGIGFLLPGFGGFDFLFALGQIEAPLALTLGLLVLALEVGLLRIEAGGFALHGGTLLVGEQFHAVGAGLELLEPAPGGARLLENLARNFAIDFGAGQFLQQFGAFVGCRVEEGGETALGEQHRLGEAWKVEAGDLGDALQFVAGLGAEDGAVAICIERRQFHLGRLQCAVHLVAGAALAPEGAVDGALHFKLDFRQAVGGVPRHDVVVGGRDGLQARRLVVKREADGIEQRRFAGAGRAGDGKQAAVAKGRPGEVDAPFTLERIEVLQAQAEDLHAASPSRPATMAR